MIALLRLIRVVLHKELVDHVRDRRSMLSALLVPSVGPLVFFLMFNTLASWMRNDGPLILPVEGRERAPTLITFLERHGATIEQAPPDHEQKVIAGKLDAVLVIPPTYADLYSRGERAPLRLEMDSSRTQSHRTITRIEHLLDGFSSELGTQRLLLRGIDPRISSPLKIDSIDLATARKSSASLLGVIPMFLLLGAFAGGMHVAIDATAGERERGSLEPLLLNPVPRIAVVVGKWLTTVLMTLLAVSVSMTGFVIAVRRVPLHDLGVRAVLDFPSVALILATIIPLTFFSAALQMLVATFARTFKEAQTYLSLLVLIPSLPGVILTLSPVNPTWWMMLIPTLGQSVLVHSVLRGEPIPGAWLLMSAGSCVLLAAALIGITTRLLASEKIVFGR